MSPGFIIRENSDCLRWDDVVIQEAFNTDVAGGGISGLKVSLKVLDAFC